MEIEPVWLGEGEALCDQIKSRDAGPQGLDCTGPLPGFCSCCFKPCPFFQHFESNYGTITSPSLETLRGGEVYLWSGRCTSALYFLWHRQLLQGRCYNFDDCAQICKCSRLKEACHFVVGIVLLNCSCIFVCSEHTSKWKSDFYMLVEIILLKCKA